MKRDHDGWIAFFIIVAVVVVATMIGNYNAHRDYHPAQLPPASYSVGTVCFDDGAGGISNPDECLP